MAFDIASAANRMAPGAPGTSPPKITFVNTGNAAVRIRPDPDPNTQGGGGAVYFAFKTSAGVCVATGNSNVAVPTTNDPRFDATDGWQDMILAPGATHIRLFGDGTGGTAYVWLNGT